ncbi:MAG: hypothetical protein WBF29_03760, partial [Syntrophobacteria bacterium]
MAVLPGVLGCRPLRRTIQVRLGTNTLWLPGCTPILFALAALRSVPQAGSQFRGLATAIHEISGLGKDPPYSLWLFGSGELVKGSFADGVLDYL